jgi:hypothetical protein
MKKNPTLQKVALHENLNLIKNIYKTNDLTSSIFKCQKLKDSPVRPGTKQGCPAHLSNIILEILINQIEEKSK